MGSGRRIIGVLLVACGLLLNYVFLARLFSNDGTITSPILLLAISAMDLFLIAFGIIIYRSGGELYPKVGLMILSILFTLSISVGIDRVYGAYFMPEIRAYVYPPFSKVTHESSEFNINVTTNNLGFRGPLTNLNKKKTKRRVLVLGDSFTFGWGVNTDETWISLLQKAYPEVEFLNLGQGGSYQADHLRILRRSINDLQPDMVIECILQGNDLEQIRKVMANRNSPISSSLEKASNPKYWKSGLREILKVIYPNLSVRRGNHAVIRDRWIAESRTIISSLSESEQHKYQKMPEHLRLDFEHGLLNPSFILNGLRHPDQFLLVSDTSRVECQMAVQYMHDLLQEFQVQCALKDVPLLVVAQPCRPFGLTGSLPALIEAGFNVDGCDTINGLLPIQLAMNDIEAPLLAPTIPNAYKEHFHYYDGHWNAEGNRIFAQELQAELEKTPLWKHFLTSSNF